MEICTVVLRRLQFFLQL